MKTFRYKTACKQVLGDLHTPVSIYLKVRDIYPQSALLESSDFHAGENSLSYIALCPLASFGVNGDVCTMSFPDRTVFREPVGESLSVTDALNAFLKKFRIEGEQAERCGLFGYTAFDAVKYFEKIPVIESHDAQNDAPDIMYILYKYLLVFNHFKNELTLIELLSDGENTRLHEIESVIGNRNFASYDFSLRGKEYSTITDEQYREFVRRESPTAAAETFSRSYCRGDSYSRMPGTTSKSTARCAASTRRPTFSISISEGFAFSDRRRKPTAKCRTAAPVSIRSPVRPGAPATR